MTVIFEQGEYIKKGDAAAIVQAAVEALPPERRPLRIMDVRVVGKLEEPCVALPDIFLGAWQQFACGYDPKYLKNRERDELLFRIIQPRIGTIFRPSTKERFLSRRNQFGGLVPPADPSPGTTA